MGKAWQRKWKKTYEVESLQTRMWDKTKNVIKQRFDISCYQNQNKQTTTTTRPFPTLIELTILINRWHVLDPKIDNLPLNSLVYSFFGFLLSLTIGRCLMPYTLATCASISRLNNHIYPNQLKTRFYYLHTRISTTEAISIFLKWLDF
jgi:hypothetical protein